jgi:hypothetical protein
MEFLHISSLYVSQEKKRPTRKHTQVYSSLIQNSLESAPKFINSNADT